MLIAHVMAEEARHRSKRAWVSVRLEQGPVQRELAGIETYARPSLLQSITQVFLTRDEIECTRLGFVCDH